MPDQQPVLLASAIDLKLRFGIFCLLNAKYRPAWGRNDSRFLCAAILNSILLEPPGNEDARVFLERNKELVEREALTISTDSKLSLAVALIYTLTLGRLGPKDWERSSNLADRASQLNIVILSTDDVCQPHGKSVKEDAMEFLSVIDQYASELFR